MAFDTLGQEPAQVGGALARPGSAYESFNWSTEHAGGKAAGFGRDLGAGQPLVTGTQETVGHGMEVGAAAIEGLTAYDAGLQVRQQSNQANDPQVEVSQGHPHGF